MVLTVVMTALAGPAVAAAAPVDSPPAAEQVASPDQQCFLDVDPTHPYYEAINGLCLAGVVDGYSVEGGKVFRPNNAVLRAQFAKMIVGSLQIPVTEDDWTEADAPFTDLEADSPDDLYPNEYVAVAYRLGITLGKTATTFAPYVDITRAQVISMVVRAAERFKGDALLKPAAGWQGALGSYYSNPYHGDNVRIAEHSGLLAGLVGFDATWDPEARASRGEVAQIMWNMRQAEGGRFGRLLLFEDFSDPASGWPVAAHPASEVGYELGRYVVRVKAQDTFAWAGRVEPLADVTVAVDVSPSEQSKGSEYGLVFRLRDVDNFYQLSVQNDDTASVWRRQGGQWTALSPAFKLPPAGADGARHLLASMQGGVITCWVDDEAIGWYRDTTFANGRVGVFAGSAEASSTAAFFDDFTVWSIDEAGGN